MSKTAKSKLGKYVCSIGYVEIRQRMSFKKPTEVFVVHKKNPIAGPFTSIKEAKKEHIADSVTLNKKPIHNAHDKAFKLAMSDIRVATEVIQNNLPSKLVSKLNLEHLQKCNSSYIDREYIETQSDMLYRVKTKTNDDCYLYFLCEHHNFVSEHATRVSISKNDTKLRYPTVK